MTLSPLLIVACATTDPTPVDDHGALPDLVFRSGFEDGTEHHYTEDTEAPCTDDLFGLDTSVESQGDWESDLEGGPYGRFHFCFGGGDRSQRALDLVADPEDAANQVLRGRIFEPNESVSDDDDVACNEALGTGARKARIHAVLQDGEPVTRLDYRFRVRLGEDAFAAVEADPREVTWMTLTEVWNNLTAEDDTFRITLNLVKAEGAGEPFRFLLEADRQDDGDSTWIHVWPEDKQPSEVVVPLGEWFTLDFTFVEGDDAAGRAIATMTDAAGAVHTIADVTDWTYSPTGRPSGFTDLNPLKLYTSGDLMCELSRGGLPLEIWWDDFALGAGL